MKRCSFCGKGPMVGRNIRHKARGKWTYRAPKTRRVFNPNIQRTTIFLRGERKRVHICTRCLRTLNKTA